MPDLKCCNCGEVIESMGEGDDPYPCQLPNDKYKWACSELCYEIAQIDPLSDIIYESEILEPEEVEEEETEEEIIME